MNERDSEFVAGVLLENDFVLARSEAQADVVLFNSCAVRQHAEDRLFSNITALEKLKAKRPNLLVGLMGCVAQRVQSSALRRSPVIDFVCGPGNEWELPFIISGLLKDRLPVVAVDKVHEKRPELFPRYRAGKHRAYVSISEGCDNFCSYCIVPYVRGRERSRKMTDIIREVTDLAARDFKEITLLGQNVNSYKGARGKGHGLDFIGLLTKIDRVKGIERIRFMTSHPKDASIELFKAMRDLPKVCEHLHLPLQSGSTRILKLMNRGYAAAHYLELVESYRKTVPAGSLTTDVIVGFPTETAQDFKSTLAVMKAAGFDASYDFMYSPRPPAKAARLRDTVSPAAKQERLEAVMALQMELARRANAPLVGRIIEVLVDGGHTKAPGMVTGRTRTSKSIVFAGGAGLAGKVVNVKVLSASPYSLKGEVAVS